MPLAVMRIQLVEHTRHTSCVKKYEWPKGGQEWLVDHPTMPFADSYATPAFLSMIHFRFNKKDGFFNCKMRLAKHRADFFFVQEDLKVHRKRLGRWAGTSADWTEICGPAINQHSLQQRGANREWTAEKRAVPGSWQLKRPLPPYAPDQKGSV